MKLTKWLFYMIFIGTGLHMFLKFHQTTLLWLLDLPALLLILAGLMLALGHFRFSLILRSVAQATGFKSDAIQPQLAREVLSTLGNYILTTGAMGTIMTATTAFGSAADIQALSHGLAVSMTSLLYALALRFLILYPLDQSLLQQDLQERTWS